MEGGYQWRVEEFRETQRFEAISGHVPVCPLIATVVCLSLFPFLQF